MTSMNSGTPSLCRRHRQPLAGRLDRPLRRRRRSAASSRKHFQPAFARAFAAHAAEVDDHRRRWPVEPTFANTIEALEARWRGADAHRQRVPRACRCPYQRRAPGNPARDCPGAGPASQRDLPGHGPVPPRRRPCFAQRERLGLTPEQTRVLEQLPQRPSCGPERRSLARESAAPAINTRLATLDTLSARTCSPTSRAALVLEAEGTLRGCRTVRAAAQGAADDRGLEGWQAIAMHAPWCPSCSSPTVATCASRPRTWVERGDNGNGTTTRRWSRDPALRGERARLLGYRTILIPAGGHDGEDA